MSTSSHAGYIYRDDYPSYYQYRKAIKRLRDAGYIIRNVCGGVSFFRYWSDHEIWENQK